MKGRWRVQRARPPGHRKPVARPPQHDERGRPLARAGARAERPRAPAARAGHPRRAARPRRDALQPARLPQDCASARRFRSSARSPGIGNMWMSEALFEARVSPWLTLADATDAELRAALRSCVAPDARKARRRTRRPARLPAQGPAVPALRRDRPLVAARRRRPHGVLVPGLPKRRGTRGEVTNSVAVRAPHLYRSLRGFALAAFRLFVDEDLPFAFEEHESARTSRALRVPAARAPVPRVARVRAGEARGRAARARGPARAARRRGSSRARTRGRVRTRTRRSSGRSCCRCSISTAEGCGGFDWDDAAFNHAYAELERSLFGKGHAYAAVAPLVGISVGTAIDLGDGLRVRNAATGELAAHWPEAQGLLPPGLRPRDRPARRDRARAQPAQGRAGAARRARRARRRRHCAATRHRGAGRRGAGAVRAARLASVRHPPRAADRRDPAGRRADPPGRVPRPARGGRPRQAARGRRGPGSSARRSTAGSCRSSRPTRSRRSSCASRSAYLFGHGDGAWAASLRAAVLLGESPEERGRLLELHEDRLARRPTSSVARSSRSSCTATAPGCSRSLDESLVGLAPPPAGYFALRAAS